MGCTQDATENAHVESAASDVDTANAAYLVDAEPVVHGENGPVKIQVMVPAQRVALGGSATVEMSLHIGPSYHIYGETSVESSFTPLRVECDTDCGDTRQSVKAHLPKPTATSNGLPVYRDDLSIEIPVTPCPSDSGKFSLTIFVQYQACNDLACFPPEKVELTLPVNIRLNDARRQP